MKRWRQSGFTIVETMIVLAVAGLLFVMIVGTLSGRQSQAEFNQAIQDIQAKIQQSLSEVQTGFYPNNGQIICTGTDNGGGAGSLSLSIGQSKQGTNKNCLFIGKALWFQQNKSKFYVFSLAGARTSIAPSSLYQITPTAISPTGQDSSGLPDATETDSLNYGLVPVSMTEKVNGANVNIKSLAFISSLGSNQTSASGTSFASGSDQVDVYGIEGDFGTTDQSQGDAASSINDMLQASAPDSYDQNPDSINICFASGTTKASGLITIGQANSELSVNLQIFTNSADCTES